APCPASAWTRLRTASTGSAPAPAWTYQPAGPPGATRSGTGTSRPLEAPEHPLETPAATAATSRRQRHARTRCTRTRGLSQGSAHEAAGCTAVGAGCPSAAAPHIRQLAACLFLVERCVHTRPRGQEQGVQHRLPVRPRVGNLPSRIRRRLIRHLFDLLRHHPGCCNRRTVRRLEVRCLGNGSVEFLD